MTQVNQADIFLTTSKHQYANLFTYRKSGEAVKTPIWFAARDGKIYIVTTKGSGKIKRVRNNPRVLIGPSDAGGTPRGATVDATARVLGPNEVEVAKDALDRKYGMIKAVFDFFMTLRGVEREWIEISPA